MRFSAYDSEMEPDPEKSLRVALVSLGCSKNLIDSERMLAMLAEGGCVVGAPMDEADVIVINTCGFVEAARAESMDVLAEALEYKRRGSAKRVVVAGCVVNRDGTSLYEQAEGIDAIVGVNNRSEILAAVTGNARFTRCDDISENFKSQISNFKSDTDGLKSQISNFKFKFKIHSDAGRFRLTPRHTAYLRISEGCSQKCTFCTIPSIRGPFRSKSPDLILDEARELIADGAIELNIIAQDTTGYGRDLPGGWNLARLLRQLDSLDGARWIRLMYAYPRRFDDELIDTIAECERLIPYVDIPLQHISDGVLKRMGRQTTRSEIETLLDKMRSRIARIAIRTTFIVGFPGESDGEFAELLDFVEKFRFDAMGAFEYSPEGGTPAAMLDGAVSDEVKARRAERLMLAQQKIVFDANAAKAAAGERVQVLIDATDGEGRCVGRTFAQAPEIDGVCYLAEPGPIGSIVSAKIVGFDNYDLIAGMIDN